MVRRAVLTLFAAVGITLAGEPIGLDRLLELLGDGIDPDIVVALVEKDCVNFDVSGENVAELSRKLPKAVLEAAIDCARRGDGDETPAVVPVAPALPPPAPAPPASPSDAATDDPLCAWVESVVQETVRERGFDRLKGKRRRFHTTTGPKTQPAFFLDAPDRDDG